MRTGWCTHCDATMNERSTGRLAYGAIHAHVYYGCILGLFFAANMQKARMEKNHERLPLMLLPGNLPVLICLSFPSADFH